MPLLLCRYHVVRVVWYAPLQPCVTCRNVAEGVVRGLLEVVVVQARASYKCHMMQHPLHNWMPAAFPPPGAPC